MSPARRSGAPGDPTPRPEHNVISLLERRSREHPDRVALMWPDPGGPTEGHGSMTYAALSRAAESVAGGLGASGIGPGDRVFIFIPMVAELYLALFGVLRLGAVAIFLDSWARRDQLAECARQVEPRGFIGPDPAHAMIEGVDGFGAVSAAVRVGPGTRGDAALADFLAAGATHPVASVRPAASALVTFTTGSSGRPKGADRNHGFLVAQHEALAAEVPYEPDDVDLPVFPVFSLNNLASGVTTVLPDLDLAAPDPGDGARLLRQLRRLGATCSTLSPSLLRGVVAAARRSGPAPALRRVITGGAPVGRQDADAFAEAFPDAELHILYGSTEVEPIAHLPAAEMPDQEGRGVCLGRPTPTLSLKFIRPTREAVALGPAGWSEWETAPERGGELLVAGPHVCPGYFRNPDAFARAKVRDADGTVWHRTGDVCVLDDSGRLWMRGRVHNAISRGEELLFPVRAELAMNALPFVGAAAYLGMPHPELGEAAWAAFILREGSPVPDPEDAVRRALTDAGVVVDTVARVEAIPMDPRHHSKVDVDALRAALLADDGTAG